MAWIAGIVGAGVSANQSYAAGQNAKGAAEYEADQREEQADGEIAAASINVDRIRQKARQYLSSQQARSSQGNQSSTDASVIAVRQETIKNASLDQLMVMAEAEERARQMKKDAYQMRVTGVNDALTGSVAGLSSMAQGASTVIDSYGSWGDTYGAQATTGATAGAQVATGGTKTAKGKVA